MKLISLFTNYSVYIARKPFSSAQKQRIIVGFLGHSGASVGGKEWRILISRNFASPSVECSVSQRRRTGSRGHHLPAVRVILVILQLVVMTLEIYLCCMRNISIYFFYKVVELVSGGSVLNGPTLSSYELKMHKFT